MTLIDLARRGTRRLLRFVSGYRGANYDRTLLRVGSDVLLGGDALKVNWVVTRKCNYTCSYCTVYDNVHGIFPPLIQMKRAVDYLAKLDRRRIMVTLTGGEPTVHPNYLDLVSYLATRLGDRCSILTITNLSRRPKYYRQLSATLDNVKSNVSYKASFHFDFASVDHFITNVETLVAEGIRIHVSLMAHPERMDDVRELCTRMDALKGEQMSFGVSIIRKNYGAVPDPRYSSTDLDWIRRFYEAKAEKHILIERWSEARGRVEQERCVPMDLIARGLNRYRGMWCEAGVSMLSINGSGDVDPAVCFRGSSRKRVNIYTGNLDDVARISHPVICPFERCGCPADLQLPKYVDRALARLARHETEPRERQDASELQTRAGALSDHEQGPITNDGRMSNATAPPTRDAP